MIAITAGSLFSACNSDKDAPEVQPQPQEEEEQTDGSGLRTLNVAENESRGRRLIYGLFRASQI